MGRCPAPHQPGVTLDLRDRPVAIHCGIQPINVHLNRRIDRTPAQAVDVLRNRRHVFVIAEQQHLGDVGVLGLDHERARAGGQVQAFKGDLVGVEVGPDQDVAGVDVTLRHLEGLVVEGSGVHQALAAPAHHHLDGHPLRRGVPVRRVPLPVYETHQAVLIGVDERPVPAFPARHGHPLSTDAVQPEQGVLLPLDGHGQQRPRIDPVGSHGVHALAWEDWIS